jgi:hypothetical protein
MIGAAMASDINYKLLESRYLVTLNHIEDAWFSSSLRGLLERDTMNDMVALYVKAIKAYGPDVAGTYFCSYLRLVFSAMQYSLTHYDVVPSMTLDDMVVHMFDRDGYSTIVFRIISTDEKACPSPELRDKWRAEVLCDFIQHTVRPLIESLAEAVKLKPSYLWAIVAQDVPHSKDKWLKEADHDGLRNRIVEDFQFLREDLAPSIFGIKKNPFDMEFTYVQHRTEPTELVPLKPVCCLAFRTHSNFGYCYTCPRISEEERAAKRGQ